MIILLNEKNNVLYYNDCQRGCSNMLSIKDLLTTLSSMPEDLPVKIQCYSKINSVGNLIIYPDHSGNIAFDMSEDKSVKDIVKMLGTKNYVSDRKYGTTCINRNVEIWATFPSVISQLQISNVVMSADEDKVLLVATRV
jgi:hypothetical protein